RCPPARPRARAWVRNAGSALTDSHRQKRFEMATTSQPGANLTGTKDHETVISAQEIHKYYELGETRVHALRGASVEIARGEFVTIMGASGSGKSTFMNILGFLDKPSTGRYLLEGVEVSSLSKKELAAIRNRKIGFVFQGFNLHS